MSVNVQTLKGFRDFLPSEARKRQYVINTLKNVFKSYGFEPLETPALEYEEVLMGKYGEEGDKLMYRFTDNGDRRVALRYDQTVPLARVIAQYQNELPMPFKRYQIQPVWRAENTQKGRFREFLQCDIDTVGLKPPLADAEILGLIYTAFKKLGLEIVIKINDRAILSKISVKALGILDKFNKIGEEGVVKELQKLGMSPQESQKLLDDVKALKASANMLEIQQKYEAMGYPKDSLIPDSMLIRGLDYYTGMILEVNLKSNLNSLSLGGGGRYDNLIGIFANKQIPAVGFAFGFDRIIQAMEELKLFPENFPTTQVLVTIFSTDLAEKSIEVSSQLRSKNISTELWLDPEAKLEKQLKYADQKQIPYVVIIGPDEAKENKVTLKDLKSKSQETLTLDEAIQKLSS